MCLISRRLSPLILVGASLSSNANHTIMGAGYIIRSGMVTFSDLKTHEKAVHEDTVGAII